MILITLFYLKHFKQLKLYPVCVLRVLIWICIIFFLIQIIRIRQKQHSLTENAFTTAYKKQIAACNVWVERWMKYCE